MAMILELYKKSDTHYLPDPVSKLVVNDEFRIPLCQGSGHSLSSENNNFSSPYNPNIKHLISNKKVQQPYHTYKSQKIIFFSLSIHLIYIRLDFFSICILFSSPDNSMFQLAPLGPGGRACIFKTITQSWRNSATEKQLEKVAAASHQQTKTQQSFIILFLGNIKL